MPDDDKDARKQIAESIERLEEIIGALPGEMAQNLKNRIATVRSILLEQRAPAFALIGRRGAGKSSLVNALFGARVAEVGHVKSQTGRGKWFDYASPAGAIAVLDTRGIQEGSAPAESDLATTPIASIAFELKKKAPDGILFLVRASDVDSAVDADLDALEQIVGEVERTHRFRPPIVAVVTACDFLEPKGTQLHAEAEEPPADVEEKLRHVHAAEGVLDKKLRARASIAPHLVKTVGVSSYMSWRDDGTLRADERWNLGALSKELYELLPNAGRGAFVRIARARGLQDELAESLTKAVAALCAAIAAVPMLPLTTIPITSAQVTLVAAIAWISGRELGMSSAGELFGALGVNVGASFALREIARALIAAAPAVGPLISAGIAFAGTMAIGAAARAYFVRGEGVDAVRRIYEKTKKIRRD
jgi:predicted GTPase